MPEWLRSFEPDAGEVYASTCGPSSFPIGEYFVLHACEDAIRQRAWPRAVCERGLDVEIARCRILRLVLEANLCRERARTNDDGTARIEVWDDDAWREIDLASASLRADALTAK